MPRVLPPVLPRPLLALAAVLCASSGLACRGQTTRPAGPGAAPDAALQPAFDPASVGPGAPPEPAPSRPLDVLDYGPLGRTEGGTELHVRFNQPVVALDLEQPAGLDRLFQIDPPLPGRASWRAPDLLVYTPDAAPAPARSYTVRFTGGLVGLDGQRFDRALGWSFETPRPTVIGSHPESQPAGTGEDQRRDSVVLVRFDRPVALTEAREHIKAVARPLGVADGGKPVPVRVRLATKKEVEEAYYMSENPREVYAVRAQGLWPGGSEVELSVTPGLRSEVGPLPLDTPWSMVLHTYRAQAIEAMSCDPADPCGLEPITLRLRNAVEPEQLKKITVSPRPKFLRIDSWDDWGNGGHEVVIEGQFVPGTSYTVRVPPTLRDVYGQTIAGGAARTAVIAHRATLGLSAGTGILATTGRQTIGVETRHVKALRVRVGVFTDAELQDVPIEPAEPRLIGFPGKVLERSFTLTPTGKADWSSLALDLADLSGAARGAVLVEVQATELTPSAASHGAPELVRGLFRLTDLGPVAVVSLPASSVQVLRLSTGAPVPGVKVSKYDPARPGALLELGATDAAGLLALPAGLVPWHDPQKRKPGDRPPKPVRIAIHEPGTNDRAYLDLPEPSLGYRRYDPEAADKASPLRPGERLLARVVSERGVYRPGEKVRVVGWSALDTPFSRSNLGRLKAGTAVRFELVDPFSKVVATHDTKTTTEGKFWAELVVPGEAALGRYTVKAALAGVTIDVGVKVEDYRVPEFTVEARARRLDILAGQNTPIDVHASYYFGGPVQIRRLTTQTDCARRPFRPPGLEDRWTVGEPIVYDYGYHRRPSIVLAEPAAPTPGRREFTQTAVDSEPRYPQRCTTNVEVQDASLQGIGAEATFAVHPAAFYLAAAVPGGYYHTAGMTGLRVPVRAVSPQGERVAVGAVEVVITRSHRERSYKAEGGKQVFDAWVERVSPVTRCKLDAPASGADPECAVPPLLEGTYTIAVEAREPGSERVARTRAQFHVWPKVRDSDTSWRTRPVANLEVLTDRDTVRPGETLEVAVRGPWPSARGQLVLARGGIREVLPVNITDKEALFKFTVDDTWTPEVHFVASVVPRVPGPGIPRPTLHSASVRVRQDYEHRRLRVAVDAPAKAGPGDSVDLAVRVRDDQDQPVAARVALWAVDEAVLDLTSHEVPDLQQYFVPRREAELGFADDFGSLLWPYYVKTEDPWFAPYLIGRSGGGGSGSGYGSGRGGVGGRGSSAGPPPARSRFETTPVFLADIAVDRSGQASVKARMPDNLTTFRITAIASARLVDGGAVGRFGKNDARTVVTAPLVLRAAMPRQLRPGDSAEVAAIVQNNTGAAGRVEVTAKVVEKPGTKGHVLKLRSPLTAGAAVADGGQARVTFQVEASGPGAPELELQAALTPDAGGPPIRDGLRLPLPVAAERTLTERVAAYGTVDDDRAIAIPIKIPTNVLPGHGGVTVDTSSTLLGGLEDAVHALVNYPYGCVEQTSSRLLPIVALHQLAKDYPLGVPDTKEFMRAGIERLLAMQTPSGGFAYWPGGTEVHVYASAYATWVLQLAAKAGHPVPEDALRRALDDLEKRLLGVRLADIPVDWGYNDGVRAAIGAHTLAEAGRDTSKPAAELYLRRQQLPLFARAFLLMAMHRQNPASPEVRGLTGELLGNLQELPATAHAKEQWQYNLDEVFASDGRSDAIVLMALLRVDPRHAVVAKLARGLLERRLGGAWRNTQENAYALVALTDYAREYEAVLPDLTARAWVGGANVLDVAFKGRELATKTAFTDMQQILGLSQEPGDELLPVVLQRKGQGRLYYRLGAEWAPSAQAELPARAQGFTVTRAVRTRSGPATTAVPAGEPIAMDLTIRSDTRVRYVVLDVPLPAGLEGVSRTLGKGRGAAVLAGHRGWWVSHEEQRPDRVVVFADDLPPGTHTHTIDLRSTSRGAFSFPPALAEAMYMPEVYGRTAGASLTVQ